MRFAGRQSWQVEHGTNLAVNTALFLRDTLALSVDTRPHLPGLDPSVPVLVPPGVDRAGITREWPGWWDEVLEFARAESIGELTEFPVHEGASVLARRPALRTAIVALRDLAARYEAQRAKVAPGGVPIGEVVRGVEVGMGRPVRPFRLVITEVRVQGMVWERLTPAHVIASEHLLQDRSRCSGALRAVVRNLA
jgi:hypothetical protein